MSKIKFIPSGGRKLRSAGFDFLCWDLTEDEANYDGVLSGIGSVSELADDEERASRRPVGFLHCYDRRKPPVLE